MSAIVKNKPLQASAQSTTELFGQLAEIFSQRGKTFSFKKASTALNTSVRQLRQQIGIDEWLMLRNVIRELASQVDRLTPENDSGPLSIAAHSAMLERAQREDTLGDTVLEAARRSEPMLMSTPESIRLGNEAMAEAEQGAAATTASRIANRELISSGELQRALDVKRQAISGAVKAKRLFAIVGPSGENYYPAYYADPTLDRRKLEQVSKLLGSLPAQAKHHFFTSKSTLLQETPLEALRKGREADVLIAAGGFAER
jgi:hypothetical protein